MEETVGQPVRVQSQGKLAKALSKAQGEFKEVTKDKEVSYRAKNGAMISYSYADLSDIRRATQPALSANGIAVMVRIDGNKLETKLVHGESGESESSSLPINTSVDPKSLGSLLTYYRRYTLSGLLGIAADEDDDSGAAIGGHDYAQKSNPQPQQNQPPAKKGGGKAVKKVTDGQLKRLYAISQEQSWDQDQVKDLLMREFNLESSKDLTMKQYDELIEIMTAD